PTVPPPGSQPPLAGGGTTENASGRCSQVKWLSGHSSTNTLPTTRSTGTYSSPGTQVGLSLGTQWWTEESAEWLRLSPITKIEPSGTGPAVQSQPIIGP